MLGFKGARLTSVQNVRNYCILYIILNIQPKSICSKVCLLVANSNNIVLNKLYQILIIKNIKESNILSALFRLIDSSILLPADKNVN